MMTNVSNSTLCLLQRELGLQSYGEAIYPESCHSVLGSGTAGLFEVHLLLLIGQGRWYFTKEIIQSGDSFITEDLQTPTLSACQFLFSQV